MQAPHRKQNHVLLAVRRRCQLLMHRATKGMFFCGSHFVSQIVRVCQHRRQAWHRILWCLSEVDATQQLTSLISHVEQRCFQRRTDNSTCCFSFSDNTTCCMCCTSAYGDQIKHAFSTCFKDAYCEGAAKWCHIATQQHLCCIYPYHTACHHVIDISIQIMSRKKYSISIRSAECEVFLLYS